MSFERRFELPTASDWDVESECTYDAYCNGEFDCESCKYKGDGTMILGKSVGEIVRKAVEYQSEMTDGVVQYNYEDGELFGAGFTTGTIENPANPFFEVFRLPQGERGEIDCKCHETDDCPFWIEDDDYHAGGYYDEEHVDQYGDSRLDCCIGAMEEDFEEEIKQTVTQEVSHVMKKYIYQTLEDLNEFYCEAISIIEPHRYLSVLTGNQVEDVFDTYVENAVEYGVNINECTPMEYLASEVEYLKNYIKYADVKSELLNNILAQLEEGS